MPDNNEQDTVPEQLFEMPDGSTMTQEQAAAMFTEHGNIKELQAASTQRDQTIAVDRADLERREQALKDALAEQESAQTPDDAMWSDNPNAELVTRLDKLEKAESERVQAREWEQTRVAMNRSADAAIRAHPAFKGMEDTSGIQSRVFDTMYATGVTPEDATASIAEFIAGFALEKETKETKETKEAKETKQAQQVTPDVSGGGGKTVPDTQPDPMEVWTDKGRAETAAFFKNAAAGG